MCIRAICKCPLTELFLLNTKEKYTVQQSEFYSVLLDRSKYFQIGFHKKGSVALMAYCAYKRLDFKPFASVEIKIIFICCFYHV